MLDSTANASALAPGVLADLPWRRRTRVETAVRLIAILPACVLAAVYIVIAGFLASRVTYSWVGWVASGLSIILVLGLVGHYQTKRARRAVWRVLDRSETSDFTTLIRRHFEHERDHELHAPILVQEVVARRALGLTLRSCRPDARRPIVPLGTPHEPIPLDESVPAFKALAQGFASPEEDAGVRSTHERNGGDAVRGTLVRRWRLQGWVNGLACAVLVFWIMLEFLVGNSVDLWMVLLTVFNLAMFVGGGAGAWTSHQQWMLVPAGLALRRPKRRRSDQWEVHLFDRRASVLLVRERRPQVWHVWVSDSTQAREVDMTQVEADILLRAWLSPLVPPPVEHLSDLT